MPTENQQYSFFEVPSEDSAQPNKVSKKIDVVKLDYIGAESLEWGDLFRGFSTLKAITFSSGIGFVGKLLDMFSEAEIIFGCEDVLSYKMHEIIAFQNKLIERIKESANITEKILRRIDNGELHLYVARTQLSHEKIYLLSAEDGRKRVVMGSANMSFNAFSGRQRENICYVDGNAAYEWYLDVFQTLKENSVDEISHRALTIADAEENIDEMPISQSVKTKKVITIEPTKVDEEVKFILDVRNLASKLSPMLPKAEKKTGRLAIVPDTVVKLRKNVIDESVRTKELRNEYPQLVVDVPEGVVTLNGAAMELSPQKEEIAKDVKLFLKYMNGYNRFHGDFLGMQYRYFEFANWFFCSPFMAVMRDMAARFDQNRLPYPVFGLLYGQSKAGKTTFLETLLKMMIGQKPKIAAGEFTRSSIEKLKEAVQGAPIIVDDMVNTRFNQHAIETIKTDDFGIADHLIHYPAVVISANEDVKAVSPEVIRRTVICRVEAGLTNTEVMKSNVVRSVQKEIGTAFYREYLRRMLEIIPDLIESMKSGEIESAPDILMHSSETIVSIMSEYEPIPEYVRPLSLENYFSEQVTGKYALKTVLNAWKTSKNSFKVDKRNNELRYNAGATYEAERIIKELPENLEARKSREWIVMKLDEAREFFGISFKRGLF